MNLSDKKAYGALILAALFSGALPSIGKFALQHVDPIELLAIRFLIGSIVALPLFIWQYRKHHPSTKDLVHIGLITLMGTIGLLIFYAGLSYTNSLQASFTGSMSGVIVTILGIILLKEHESRSEWLGLSLTILGSLLIVVLPTLLAQSTSTPIHMEGNLLILASIILGSMSAIILKRYYSEMPKLLISCMSIFAGSAVISAILILRPQTTSLSQLIQPAVLLPGVYLALFGSLISSSLSYFGYSTIDASKATLFSYLKPISYIPLSVLWLEESIVPIQLFGLLVIIIGVIIAERHTPTKAVVHIHEHH